MKMKRNRGVFGWFLLLLGVFLILLGCHQKEPSPLPYHVEQGDFLGQPFERFYTDNVYYKVRDYWERETIEAYSSGGVVTPEILDQYAQRIDSWMLYLSDEETKGYDYWQTYFESLWAHMGDCEDFAIAVMALLYQDGYDLEKSGMGVVILKRFKWDEERGERVSKYHAVPALSLNEKGSQFIYVSFGDDLECSDNFTEYFPILGFTMNTYWIYVYEE
jgi:hypothetical protein